MTDARLTQSIYEIVTAPIPDARLTQSVYELVSLSSPSTGPLRVSGAQMETAQQYSDLPARVSGVGLESTQQYSDLPARVSGVGLESTQQYSAVPVRVSQIGLEILRPSGCFSETPPEEEIVTTVYPIRRVRRAPHVHSEMDWVFYNAFEVELEAGIGLESGQGSEPMVMIRWSNDGGHTWELERMVSAGKLGEYARRVRIAGGLGRSRDRVFEVSVSDPVKWILLDAWLDVKKGTH